MRRKTILYVMPTFCMDGPGQVLHGILRHLDPSRFRAAVVGILSKKDGGMWQDGKSVFRRMGVEVIDLDLPKPWDLFCLPRLLRVMRDLRPDVIHTQLIRADLYGRAADALYRAPRLISTVHYVEDWARSRHPVWSCVRAADCLTQRLVDCLVSVSHSVQEEVLRFYGRHAPRYEVILNGIEPIDQPRAAPGALAQQMGWSGNTVTVLFTGRLHPRKNVAFLIEAFARMLRLTRTPVGMVIVGDGPLRQELQSQAEQLGIGVMVRFAGQRNDVRNLMRQADIFALCSLGEGLSIAVLEAMDAALPCVVTDVPGLNEAVRHGQTGWLVPPGNADASAEALARLAENPSLRIEMGAAGRLLLLERFTAGAMSRKYQRLYLE